MTTISTAPDIVTIAEDGLVRVDGIAAFRKIVKDGVVYLQFCDHDRMRSQCRGSKFVEVKLDEVTKTITEEIKDGSTSTG